MHLIRLAYCCLWLVALQTNSWADFPELDLNDFSCGYHKSSSVPKKIWKKVCPYFIPKSHPIKPNLDKIFRNTKQRITLDEDSLEKAGFMINPGINWSGIVVVFHPDLPGYVLKIYTDDAPVIDEWKMWLQRIEGAQIAEEAIQILGFSHLMKTPKKWIYPLPNHPSPPHDVNRKYFILVAEDMNIYLGLKNQVMWKHATRAHLRAIYLVCQEGGLIDSPIIWNAPFSIDEKVALIDTEKYHEWPISYRRLTPYLSPPMQQYWKHITGQN